MAAPKESRYHTIDMKAVRLSPDIDPQRMKTQLSLRAVRAVTEKPAARVPAWIVLLLVGGALGTCLWWFARWRHVRGEFDLGAPAVSAGPAPSAGAPLGIVSLVPTSVQAPAAAPLGSVGLATAESTDVAPAAAPARAAAGQEKPEPAVRGTESDAKPASRAPASGRSQVKPVAAQVSPAPRRTSSPSTSAAADGPPPTPTQPKLWLE